MSRSARALCVVVAFLLAGAAAVEARGTGARVGAVGGAKRGKRATRASAQVESLIQETFRRDALRRLRHADW